MRPKNIEKKLVIDMENIALLIKGLPIEFAILEIEEAGGDVCHASTEKVIGMIRKKGIFDTSKSEEIKNTQKAMELIRNGWEWL